MTDISDRPMSELDAAIAAVWLVKELAAQTQAAPDEMAAQMNRALAELAARVDERPADLVAGPTSIDRTVRDAEGNMTALEEYGAPRREVRMVTGPPPPAGQ